MAKRLFQRSSSATLNGWVISPTQPASTTYRGILESFAGGSNGISIVLAAGGSASTIAASIRFGTSIPNFTGTAPGSWKFTQGFQGATAPANVYSKVRVHRATVSGSVVTIATTSEWSDETLTNKTLQRWEHYLDQVDLGTWASTNLLVVEYAYRNAGTASITIQPVGGNFFQNSIYTPFDTSAAFGFTNQLPVGQRKYNYSQGGIRGTNRYLKQTTSVISSTGTATGTKDGSDFNGTVSGVSTSSGTIAGSAGFTGSTVGSSTSVGSVAAGQQGFTGSTTGQSTTSGSVSGIVGLSGSSAGSSVSSGVVAGTVGLFGSVNGESISTGTAQGSPTPPSPERRPSGIPVRRRMPYPIKPIHASGTTRPVRIYSIGYMLGNAGQQGVSINTIKIVGHAIGVLGYGGTSEMGVFRSTGKLKKPMHIRATFDIEELFVMGEI